MNNRSMLLLILGMLLLGLLSSVSQTQATPKAAKASAPAFADDTLLYDPSDAQLQNSGSAPQDFTPLSATQVLFTAVTAETGRELWTTDGTLTGTLLLADLYPGPASSDPIDLTVIDGEVWFWAYDGDDGPRQLWRTDGTSSGTMPLSVAYAKVSEIRSGELAKVNARLLFAGVDAAGGAELWRSNGAADTVRVKDINPGPGSSDPQHFTGVGGWLYFSAFDGQQWGLWRTDRTSANTTQIYPGVQITAMIASAQGVYFSGSDAAGNCGVWRSDGSQAGTVQVATACGRMLTDVSGALAFTSADQHTLYVSDGTALSAQAVYSDTGSIVQMLAGRGALGASSVYLVQHRFIGWLEADGSPFRVDSRLLRYTIGDGIVPLMEGGMYGYGTTISTIVAANETLFIGTDQHIYAELDWGAHWSDFRLYKYDGSSLDPVTTYETGISASELAAWGDHVIFQGDVRAGYRCCNVNSEPWLSDGTEAGTYRIKDIGGSAPATTLLSIAALPNAVLATSASRSTTVLQLDTRTSNYSSSSWCPTMRRITPTNQSARLVGACSSGFNMILFSSDGSAENNLTLTTWPTANQRDTANASTFWMGYKNDDGGHTVETDGTAAGTQILPPADTLSYDFAEAVALDDRIIYTVRHDYNGVSYKLWSQAIGWQQTLYLTSTPFLAPVFHDLTRVEDYVYFAGVKQLWRTNGTPPGTEVVHTFSEALPPASSIHDLVAFQEWLYFRVDTASGTQQWRSNGSVTERVHDAVLAASPGGSWRVSGATLFFVGFDAATGHELWATDGDPAHTHLVADINPGPADGVNPQPTFNAAWIFPQRTVPFALYAVPGGVVLAANDGRHGYEPWFATSAQATLLVDTAPGPASSLYRLEDRYTTNPRLWSAYGSYGSTDNWSVAPINRGDDPQQAGWPSFTDNGSELFWAADDLVHGTAVQHLPLTALGMLAAPARVLVHERTVLPLALENQQLTAQPISVTLTLDPGVTYLGDSSGLTPSIAGQQISWRIPAQAAARFSWSVELQLPSGTVGSRYQATLSSPQMTSTAIHQIELVSAYQVHVPLVQR